MKNMTFKHKRKTNVMVFEDKLRQILRKVIDRDIALEYNTGGFQQLKDVFALYRSMGGTRVTLGSDAHRTERIAGGFDQAAGQLRSLGFDQICYYQNRRVHSIKL